MQDSCKMATVCATHHTCSQCLPLVGQSLPKLLCNVGDHLQLANIPCISIYSAFHSEAISAYRQHLISYTIIIELT